MGKRIAAILILGALAIGVTAWMSQPGEDKEMAQQVALNDRWVQSNERVKQINLETIELQLGSSDFTIYQQCHRAAPTTKEHQRLCAQVEKKLSAKQAEAKAHPW
jgi:hypothetical protein